MSLLCALIDSTRIQFEESETYEQEGFKGGKAWLDQLSMRVSQLEVSFLVSCRPVF